MRVLKQMQDWALELRAVPNPETRNDIKKQTTICGTTPSLGTGVATLTLGVDLEPGGVGARHPSNKPNTRALWRKMARRGLVWQLGEQRQTLF